MNGRSKRLWIELGLAVASGCLLVLTLVSREWIELLFGVDPDGGSGALEWLIVASLSAFTLLFSVLARREHRRLTSARSTATLG